VCIQVRFGTFTQPDNFLAFSVSDLAGLTVFIFILFGFSDKNGNLSLLFPTGEGKRIVSYKCPISADIGIKGRAAGWNYSQSACYKSIIPCFTLLLLSNWCGKRSREQLLN